MNNFYGGNNYNGQSSWNNPNQYPPYGYNNEPYYAQLSYVQEQRRQIKKLSVSTGLCIIAYLVFSYVIGSIMDSFFHDLYWNNMLFSNGVSILIEILCIFLPFFIVSLTTEKNQRDKIYNYEFPKSFKLFITAFFVGLMMCMIANYVSIYFAQFLSNFGLNTDVPSYETPTGGPAVILYFISISVVPAFVEEFALRGVVMQPLRKYGDWFAIIVSGALFAIIHGNATQSVFAFIVGVTIGYFVVATGSLWTGIAIHFANNAYSAIMELLSLKNEALATTVYNVFTVSVFILGVIALTIFLLDKKRIRPADSHLALTAKQKLSAYVFTAPMIISIILLMLLVISYLLAFTAAG